MMLIEDLIARRPDIRLLSARDGLRGVEIARASLPDVILMDINLPGISGIKALQILAQDPTTAHIPVVALSANAMPRDIAKGLEAQQQAIGKDQAALVNVIRALSEGGQSFMPENLSLSVGGEAGLASCLNALVPLIMSRLQRGSALDNSGPANPIA